MYPDTGGNSVVFILRIVSPEIDLGGISDRKVF